MKKKLLLVCVIILSILSSACHMDRTSNNMADSGQAPNSIQGDNQEDNQDQDYDQAENASRPEKSSVLENQNPISPNASSSGTAETDAAIGTTESEATGAATLKFDIKALKNIDADAGLISNRYFKAGNIRSAISFSLTQDWKNSDRLTCDFLLPDNQCQNGRYGIAHAAIDTESGKMDYSVIPEFTGEDQEKGVCRITFHLDETVPYIAVDGNARLKGEYYSFQSSFSRPEVFTRYLSKVDLYLYPTEDLRLLRNEIYAAHGRKFDSKVLNQYFSAKA